MLKRYFSLALSPFAAARICGALHLRILGLVLVLPGGFVSAQVQFVDEGPNRGVQVYAQAALMGGGVAASDMDLDGDVDLFVPNAEGYADQLYVNDGLGRFSEQASARGLASVMRSRSALWLDIDSDRDLDLVVGTDCFGFLVQCEAGASGLRLYRQEPDGQFVDVTVGSGLIEDMGTFGTFQHRGGLASADYDGDGDLDLYTAIWDSAMPGRRGSGSGSGASRLYRNEGAGTFTDVTASAGLVLTGNVGAWQPVWLDVNADHRLDLLLSIDFGPNRLFINNGLGGFVDHAVASGFAWAGSDLGQDGGNDMGLAVGDFDNDGDFDIYSTNIWDYNHDNEHNALFRNDSTAGSVSFTDTAAGSPVGDTDWGWGAAFLDHDLDGDLDLAVTNGFSEPAYVNDPSRFFRNDGSAAGYSFVDDSVACQFDDTLWGSALIAADLDRDGRPDMIQTTKDYPSAGPLRLMMNRSAMSAKWLRVTPRIWAGGNHHAIGAIVTVQTPNQTQVRQISAGGSFLGQEPSEALFGLAANEFATITVTWPDGSQSPVRRVRANQAVEVRDVDLQIDSFE